MHAWWVADIEKFTFTLNHKASQLNKVANVLSRRTMLLTTIRNEVIDFTYLKKLYGGDKDFQQVWAQCSNTHGVSRIFRSMRVSCSNPPDFAFPEYPYMSISFGAS